MRPRLRIIFAAFGAALLAFTFALPVLKGKRCTQAGGSFDRLTMTCDLPR
ncbi:hypothetical protein [Sphingomonas sp. Leaf62]|nr:hypothetical protein [Sphingomonas sp. Leaf62]